MVSSEHTSKYSFVNATVGQIPLTKIHSLLYNPMSIHFVNQSQKKNPFFCTCFICSLWTKPKLRTTCRVIACVRLVPQKTRVYFPAFSFEAIRTPSVWIGIREVRYLGSCRDSYCRLVRCFLLVIIFCNAFVYSLKNIAGRLSVSARRDSESQGRSVYRWIVDWDFLKRFSSIKQGHVWSPPNILNHYLYASLRIYWAKLKADEQNEYYNGLPMVRLMIDFNVPLELLMNYLSGP